MNTTIDEQFIEYIVSALVGNPDAVSIKRTIDEKGVLLELTVAQEDLGRVIGKRGAGAQALRTLLRALGTKHDARYNLKIVDPEAGKRPEKPRKNRRDEEQDPNNEAKAEEVSAADEPENEDEVALDSSSDEQSDDQKSSSDDDRLSKTRQELADLDDLDI